MVVDNFDVYSGGLIVSDTISPKTNTNFVTANSSNIIGNERDLGLTVCSNIGEYVYMANVGGGYCSFGASYVPSTGYLKAQWDGEDASLTLNPSGLGELDFSSYSSFNISMRSTRTVATLALYVYSGSVNEFCSSNVTIPRGFNSLYNVHIPFSTFSHGCDFAQVGAIEAIFSTQGLTYIITDGLSVF